MTGVRGAVLEPSWCGRGEASSRVVVGEFELAAQAVIVTSGGIGGNHDLVRATGRSGSARRRRTWSPACPRTSTGGCSRSPRPPAATSSTPTACGTTSRASATGTRSGTDHGIRILPGPSSLWLDALGRRLPAPLFPGFDTLGTLAHIMRTGYEHTWFVLTQKIIEKEFALSGSEQNPDITGKSIRQVLGRGARRRARPGRGVQAERRGLRRRARRCPSSSAG